MQATGGAGRLSEDGCAGAYKESLTCESAARNADGRRSRSTNGNSPSLDLLQTSPSGLDKNGYDKSKCEDFFEAYKACKTREYEARRKARVDARRGNKSKGKGG